MSWARLFEGGHAGIKGGHAQMGTGLLCSSGYPIRLISLGIISIWCALFGHYLLSELGRLGLAVCIVSFYEGRNQKCEGRVCITWWHNQAEG